MNTDVTTTTEVAPTQTANPQNASQAIVSFLTALGVRYAFGVSGGAIAAIWGALSDSAIRGGALPA